MLLEKVLYILTKLYLYVRIYLFVMFIKLLSKLQYARTAQVHVINVRLKKHYIFDFFHIEKNLLIVFGTDLLVYIGLESSEYGKHLLKPTSNTLFGR